MVALKRYKELIAEVERVFNAFLAYHNGDTGFYKECVSRWALSDLDTLKTALLSFDAEDLRHELYGLDGKPLKRFCSDIEQRYMFLYDEEKFSTESNKELFSLLQETHGKDTAIKMMHNLGEIAAVANMRVGDVCSIIDELQPQRQIPAELDTPEAKMIFEKAIEKGLMNDKFIWLKTKSLLACFCCEMSDKLKLGKGQKLYIWKPFEQLFGVENLRGAKNDLEKIGVEPRGIEDLKAIFNE